MSGDYFSMKKKHDLGYPLSHGAKQHKHQFFYHICLAFALEYSRKWIVKYSAATIKIDLYKLVDIRMV